MPIFTKNLLWAALLGILAVACGPASVDSRRSTPKTENDADGTDPGDDKPKEEEPTKPVTKFVKPAQALEPTVEGSYEFKLAFGEEPAGTTWSLYYTTEKGNTETGAIILADQALSVVSYTWSMGGLDEGEYFFYLTLNYPNGGNTVVAAGGSVNYSEAGATSNVSPQITAFDQEFAAGKKLVRVTDKVEISYNVFDADGDDVTVKIELRDDGGVTYGKVLATNAPKDGFTWDVADSGVTEGLYRIRISATDGVSVADEETSAAPFVVSNGETYNYEDDIKPILSANCVPCHSESGQGAEKFRWDSYGNGPNAPTPDIYAGYMASRIVTRAVDFETMPQGGPPLDYADQAKLKIWFLQDAPN